LLAQGAKGAKEKQFAVSGHRLRRLTIPQMVSLF
jgi:hypothetical protein